MHRDLVKPITVEEIRGALKSIKGDKAPGPDSFCSSFFQHNWDIVGQDLIDAVLLFFEKGYILKEWNSTALTLALPIVMSQSQSAFIKGRSIVDNVLLMHELIRNYHRNDGSPRCAIKVGIMKAYDSVDWDFLLDTMKAMEFPTIFVGWVKECITTPKFSIMINGGLEGYFLGARDLRQGDPISPYIFLLVMEAFSSLLQWNIEAGEFTYHPKCQAQAISHVVFADDLFILSSALEKSLHIIFQTLKDFHGFFGMQPNLLKSAIYFAGVPSTTQQELSQLLGIPVGQLPVQYLGVPLISTRLTSSDSAVLKERILAKIHNLKHIGAKVNWAKLCVLKNEGGLGFRSIKEWNKAVNMKHLWVISQKADTLWVKWVHVYILRGQSLWGVQIPCEASWVIRKLLKLRDTCQEWIRLLASYWALYKRFGETMVAHRGRALQAEVSSIIDEGVWKWPRQRNRAIMEIMRETPDGFLPSPSVSDTVIWTLTADGKYSAKSAWEACRHQNPVQPWHAIVWFGYGVPRWSFIEWQTVLGRLPSGDRLVSWGMVVSPQCVLCSSGMESHAHLFFDCHFSSSIWQQILSRNGITRSILPLSQELEWAL
ncbi:uncharacterized protein LOC131327886 [Rhododendron vialii]|uniref:uncharacterized protein LOC131327886 n=1 Tax=Rhododendron vialii TaxID=182163 RepID=UPI00265DA8B9|nr:uncharacterized protein LOC131327886 [Rhododendron vialii]